MGSLVDNDAPRDLLSKMIHHEKTDNAASQTTDNVFWYTWCLS